MLPFGLTRYVDVRVYNGASPVLLLTAASFTLFFTRNHVACSDPLSFIDLGAGRYNFYYTPSAAGHDYLEIGYAPTGYFLMAPEDIVDLGSTFSTNNASSLTQNYGGTGALVPSVSNPSSYTLYVYNSSDWISGNTDTSQAVSATTLDAHGNWIQAPLVVLHGTYHLILRDSSGNVVVFKANLVT